MFSLNETDFYRPEVFCRLALEGFSVFPTGIRARGPNELASYLRAVAQAEKNSNSREAAVIAVGLAQDPILAESCDLKRCEADNRNGIREFDTNPRHSPV